MKQMIRIIVALGVVIGIALPPPTAAALPPVTHTNHTRHHAARPAFSEAFLFATVAPAGAGSEGPLIGSMQTGGGSANEFVGIYNPTDQPVQLSDEWRLVARGNTDHQHQVFTFSGQTVPARSQLFVRHDALAGASQAVQASDLIFNHNGTAYTAGRLPATGSLQLMHAEHAVDTVRWAPKPSGDELADSKTATWQRCLADGAVQGFIQNPAVEAGLPNCSSAQQTPPADTAPEPPTGDASHEPARVADGSKDAGKDHNHHTDGASQDKQQPQHQATSTTCEHIAITEVGAPLAAADQFIELQNTGSVPTSLKGCWLQTNRSKSAKVELGDSTLDPGQYHLVQLARAPITLTKTKAGRVYIIDANQQETAQVDYPALPAGTTWALDDSEAWQVTYTPTPGADNVISAHPLCPSQQQWDETAQRCRGAVGADISCPSGYHHQAATGSCRWGAPEATQATPCTAGYERSPGTNRCRKQTKAAKRTAEPCQAGWYRNPATKRCNKIIGEHTGAVALKKATAHRGTTGAKRAMGAGKARTGVAAATCKPGQVRNPATGRCKAAITASSKKATATTACKPGQVRNPATGRCKNMAKSNQPKPCKPGYERNPATNRCRKVAHKATTGQAGYAPQATTDQSSGNIASWVALGGLGAVALGYAGWEWRHEIALGVRRLFGR